MAGTLGRCLGALGSRQNCSRHYANLLHTAIPTLLNLASNESVSTLYLYINPVLNTKYWPL